MQTSRLNKILKYWLPVFAWMSVIFLFSSHPTTPTSKIYWKDFIVKKTAHLIEYGTLTTLFYRAFVNSNIKKRKAALISIILSVLYGLSDEFHQSFTPGRMPRFYDVIFDTIGSTLAIYFIWKLLPKIPKKFRILVKQLEIT